MADQYYIRTEGYIGDSLIWWRPNSQGYTSDLNAAGKYSKEEADKICSGSKSEAAYQCDKLDKHPKAIFRTANANYIGYKEADINYRK